MKIYEAEKEDVVESIIEMLEQESRNKIFTMRVLDKEKDELNVIVVFEDKSVLHGFIHVGDVEGKLALRVRGNYI